MIRYKGKKLTFIKKLQKNRVVMSVCRDGLETVYYNTIKDDDGISIKIKIVDRRKAKENSTIIISKGAKSECYVVNVKDIIDIFTFCTNKLEELNLIVFV